MRRNVRKILDNYKVIENAYQSSMSLNEMFSCVDSEERNMLNMDIESCWSQMELDLEYMSILNNRYSSLDISKSDKQIAVEANNDLNYWIDLLVA